MRYESNNTLDNKISWQNSELDRIMYICSNECDFISNKKWFLNRLLQRGYNEHWIRTRIIHPNYLNRNIRLNKLELKRIEKLKFICNLLVSQNKVGNAISERNYNNSKFLLKELITNCCNV